MERKVFCEGSKCATVTINIPGQLPFVYVSRNTPVIFNGVTLAYIEKGFSPVRAILTYEAPFVIATVRLLYDPYILYPDTPCPSIENGMLSFSGNRILVSEDCALLGQGYSSDPPCPYRICSTGQGKLVSSFSDKLGEFFSIASDDVSFTYSVECDSCCNENEILCKSRNYPGWKCVPMPPISNRLGKMQSQIE